MSVTSDFSAVVARVAVAALNAPEMLPPVLALAASEVLRVDGASLSVLSDNLRMPIGASNAESIVAESLQFTLGEGPCLDVFHGREPVRYTADQIAVRWPIFDAHWRITTPFGSCASIPLELGDGLIGALDLYLIDDAGVPDDTMADAVEVAAGVTRSLLSSTVGVDGDRGPDWLHSSSVRRRAATWSAISRVFDLTKDSSLDALARLRGYAFSRGLTVDEVAHNIVEGLVDPQDIVDD